MLSKEYRLFGGTIEIAADIDESMAEEYLDMTYAEGKRLQKIFDFYDPKSELSKLNVLRRLKASDDLLKVIQKAIHYAKSTNGEYDITLGKNILLRKQGKELLKLGCSYKDIKIEGNLIELLHDDILVDLGSIAKGYIADKIIEYMQYLGIVSGRINARGEIRIYGAMHTVEVQHPRDKNKIIDTIKINNMAVATSGDYNQYHGGYENSHILGQKDFISVTVLADTLFEADAATTALFVLRTDVSKYLKQNKLKALIIDKELKKHYYNGFEEWKEKQYC